MPNCTVEPVEMEKVGRRVIEAAFEAATSAAMAAYCGARFIGNPYRRGLSRRRPVAGGKPCARQWRRRGHHVLR